MKKNIALMLFIFMIMLIPEQLLGQQRRGAELRIEKKKGGILMGNLVAVSERKQLLLLEGNNGKDHSVNISNISTILISTKNYTLAAILIGGTIGGVTAAAMYKPSGMFDFNEGGVVMFGGILGGYLGSILSKRIFADYLYFIDKMTEAEISELLEELRKKARVPDYN